MKKNVLALSIAAMIADQRRQQMQRDALAQLGLLRPYRPASQAARALFTNATASKGTA